MRILAPLLALALLLAAGSALYWTDTLRREPVEPPTAAAPHEPDYYFTEFTLREYEGIGNPTYELTGTRMTRFADDGSGEITAPELDYSNREGPPWRVTARRAELGPEGNRVDLVDDVLLVQGPGGGDPVTVRTSRLTVFTEAGRAETEQPVTATGPGWRMAATGMTAWFDRELIALHNDVEGRHASRP